MHPGISLATLFMIYAKIAEIKLVCLSLPVRAREGGGGGGVRISNHKAKMHLQRGDVP